MLSFSDLTFSQEKVLDAVLSGHNIFFGGAAGSGKSYLVNKISQLSQKVVAVTSTTGRAAKVLKAARTIHSFTGIGDCHEPKEVCHKLSFLVLWFF